MPSAPTAPLRSGVVRSSFGRLPDGTEAAVFALTSASGSRVRVTDYGGIVASLEVPDRDGRLGDVVLGFDSVAGYTSAAYRRESPFFGAVIGRHANRIAGGRFQIDGETHRLATNEGPTQLHGGDGGFHTRQWDAEPFRDGGDVGVRLGRVSPDGEEGFPGTLAVGVTYTLTDDDRLVIDYHATTDAPTLVNLTQHSYFNLAADPSRDVRDHELSVRAGAFLPVDARSIPTGEVRPAAGTPFDFGRPARLGARLGADDDQLRQAGGYDHAFLLDGPGVAARLAEPTTGRSMTVETTAPSLQLYTGQSLTGRLAGKRGVRYGPMAGVCLETQHPPDAPNQPGLPSPVVRPGETYRSRTVYAFRADG